MDVDNMELPTEEEHKLKGCQLDEYARAYADGYPSVETNVVLDVIPEGE